MKPCVRASDGGVGTIWRLIQLELPVRLFPFPVRQGIVAVMFRAEDVVSDRLLSPNVRLCVVESPVYWEAYKQLRTSSLCVARTAPCPDTSAMQ